MDRFEPQSFAAQAATGCPEHLDLALALASELRALDPDAVDAHLDLLAVELADADALTPREQLDALARLMRAFAVIEPLVGSRDLMVDQVLETFEGSPLALAPIAVDAARRAGIRVGIIGDGVRHLVAHCELEDPIALDLGCAQRPPRVEPVDERALSWRCAHQVSFATLGALIDRGTRGGDLPLALRAADLRLKLPLDGESRSRQEGARDRLRARLN